MKPLYFSPDNFEQGKATVLFSHLLTEIEWIQATEAPKNDNNF